MARIEAQSEVDVMEAVASARARRSTFEIVSHGTKRGYGRSVTAGDVLDVSALSGVVSYEPDELVITAKAATTIAEVEDAISRHRQRLGFAPADWGPLFGAQAGTATIAGILSADACGSARVRFGAARDHLLGFRAVNGFAESYKAGGRVVKNVTGFDLPKLLCGAMGTLGVLTEVTLRLVPAASASATLLARDVAPASGFALLRRAWTSAYAPTGLAYVPRMSAGSFASLGDVGIGVALLRVEAAPAPLKEMIAGLRALARDQTLEECDGETVFRDIGSGAAFAGKSLDVWRVMVPPQAAMSFLDELKPELWIADWAGGLLWLGVSTDDEDAARQIRDTASRHGGPAILMRASERLRERIPVFPQEAPALAALTRAVKASFDPLGIFNPGRMFESV